MATEITTSQEYVYFGKIINVRVDNVRLAGGMPARREVVEHADAVAILALDEQGNVLLVRQFRKPVEQELLEIPAGVINEGESPEQAAQRELAEEAGLAADRLERLVGYYAAPGWTTEYLHIFAARGLHPTSAQADDDEDITPHWLPLREALAMIRTGEIRDAKTIIALLSVALRQGAPGR